AEDHVVVRLLERREPGQDDVGVAGGLVHVDVEAHHELERVERAVEALTVGRAEHRVTGDGHERTDLPVARRLDLLGEASARELAVDLRRLADSTPPAAETHPLPFSRSATRMRASGGGAREHRATQFVEMTREQIDDVHQPARERAELLRAGADPAVDRGTLARGELAR